MKELLYLKDDQLKDLIEKLFVSYRETFSDSKKILNRYSIGLAHHKVIHLLSMYEGILTVENRIVVGAVWFNLIKLYTRSFCESLCGIDVWVTIP